MPEFTFHVTSAGNEVMAHIAGLLAHGLRASGVAASVVTDGLPLEDHRRGATPVIVAPHEFFPLYFVKCRPTIELDPTLAASAVVNVEQPGSQWFEIACEFARQALKVFDISPAGVAEFSRRGVIAHHLPLGWSPLLEADRRPPVADRPIDILFLGHASARRHAFFARHAQTFASRNAHIVLSEVHRPRTGGTPGFASGTERLELIASARILLCVHSSDRPYFEQHRALLALANGALLVTETSRHTAPLVEGVHFAMAPLDDLPALCLRYLSDLDRLQKVADAGRQLAAEHMRIESSCGILVETLSSSRASEDSADRAERTAVRGRIAEAAALASRGSALWSSHGNAAYERDVPPAVSVVVTLFNYRNYIVRALQSVVAAEPPAGGVEIVIVDDHSTDDSAAIVAAWMAACDTPTVLVRKTLNTGLADARNVGLGVARANRVFVLDADNWIYPQCLTALQEALEADAASGAYGLIARIEEETGEGVDLLSALAWSPRRLVEGPYLDAMAMFDRQAVLAVGGYSTELIDHGWFGWEDYDLFLKLAQAGHSCRFVPRIVAGYRDHGASMLRRTNRSSERLAEYFKTKFADLLAHHPGLDTHFAFPAEQSDRRTPQENEVLRLRAQMAALEQQLADVYASKSWRVTAPLRALLRMVGRVD